MSKKSSSFKRKLQARKFGFRYYRIWGSPLRSPEAVSFARKDPSSAVFQFYGTTIQLRVEVGYVGMDNHMKWKQGVYSPSLVPYEKGFRKRYQRGLNGSLLPGCYFRTVAQAQRELALYASGCKTDGIPELIEYHQDMDRFDEMMRIHYEE